MNELRQESYASEFAGKVLHGSGRIENVEECGLMDDSARWGSGCIMVLLDAGEARIALYFSEGQRDTVAELNVGQRYTFDHCVANSITNWGFWSTATCDMPA
jgi:hypothetical protein